MQRSGIEEIYELTPMQQGMLIHTLHTPEASVFSIQLNMALEGAIDADAIETAWRSLVARHTPLRTSFVWEGVEKPYQVVHYEAPLTVARHDWSALSSQEREERTTAFLQRERTLPFDLNRPPLIRVTLISEGPQACRLVWTFHHIILEGWSVAILLGEFWKLYGFTRAGRAPDLPSPRPFAHYVDWIRNQDRAQAESYWREALAGFGAANRLAIDRSTGNALPDVRRVESCTLKLPGELGTRLRNLCRAHRLTLNTVFQGAWAIVLSRYSGDADVVFGAVVSGRPADLPDAESMVGLFVNTLPARVHVNGNDRLVPWLQEFQLKQATMRQYEYSSLMQVRAFSDVPGGQPLFNTALAFENWLGGIPSGQISADLRVRRLRTEEESDQPLSLFVVLGPPVELTLMYDVERFDPRDIDRMLGHCRTLLEDIAADPNRCVADLSLLTRTGRAEVLIAWNRTQRDFPREASVHELFERLARRTPESAAVECDDGRLSYRELNERANRLAHHLRSLGVGPDVMVGMCLERSSNAVVAMLGILKAGGAYVPLDPEYPTERLAFMLEDTQAPVVVTQSGLEARLPERGARIVCLDRDWPVISGCGAQDPASGATAESLAYVIYTSGSTGTPKGVQVTHRAINRLVCNTDYVEIGAADRFAQVSVTSFDAATFEIWGALLNGACVVGVPREVSLSPREFADFLSGRGITVMFLTTALFNQMARAAPGAFRPLRYLLFGGEAVDPSLVRAVLRDGAPRHLLHVYGPTEVTTYSTWYRVTEVDEAAVTVPIGRPIANTTAYVLDEHRQPVPMGLPGELYLGGDGIARGYLKRPELTAERFVRHPFSDDPGARLYRTGDWVRRRPDGEIEFIGRRDRQVKVRGFRIELGEIEAALGRVPEVREAVVMVREDEPGDRRVVAYWVPKDAQAQAGTDLRGALRHHLPDYMLPAACVAMDNLPLTPNGKVDRGALPPPSGDRPDRETLVAPRSELEEHVAQVWREVLHLEQVGVHDNFFDLGGNSLLLIRVHGKLRAVTGREIRVVDLFQFPTIALLAENLGEERTPDSDRQQQIQERAKNRIDAARRRRRNVSET